MARANSPFETRSCTRCGGGGHYSFCPGYGTRCFKCRGTGVIYTKRGAVAAAYFSDLLHVPASVIEPGDLLFFEGFTCGSFSEPSRWEEVTSVRPGDATLDGGQIIDGVVIPPALVIETKSGRLSCSLTTKVRRGATAETKRAALAKALYFQSTLNKLGEVAGSNRKKVA